MKPMVSVAHIRNPRVAREVLTQSTRPPKREGEIMQVLNSKVRAAYNSRPQVNHRLNVLG